MIVTVVGDNEFAVSEESKASELSQLIRLIVLEDLTKINTPKTRGKKPKFARRGQLCIVRA